LIYSCITSWFRLSDADNAGYEAEDLRKFRRSGQGHAD